MADRLRGYGGDWALSQYFVFYYLTWGEVFRPEDIYAGNLLSALESVDQGVTTTLDWSHARTPEYGEAALQAFREIPGRFVLAYGNYLGAPWEWSNSPEFRKFVTDNFRARRHARPADGLRRPGQRGVPRGGRVPGRSRARPAGHDARGRVGRHDRQSISHMYDGGWMTDKITYVHGSSLSPESYQKIAATGGTVSVATESEQSAGQGYPSTWQVRKYGIPTSLSMDTSVWWSADFFSAMRARSARSARATTSRRRRRARRSTSTVSVRRTSCGRRPWAARRRSA